jgi:DNA invertase Pin-like site-specific DNA recombinase
MTIPAFAYGRYSTETQDENTSMENQMLACNNYAKANGLEIVTQYCDNAVSGSLPIEQRPTGRKMINAIEKGEKNVKAIVIYVPDRASRDWVNAGLFRKFLKRKGIECHFTNLGLVSGVTELLVGFMDMFAEQELLTITDRLMKGKRNTVALHKRMVLAVYSYGYTKIGKGKTSRLEINIEQSKLVREIFELYVYKNRSQMAIADYLNSLDVPTFTGMIPSQCPNGKAWFSHSINQILGNPIYKGVYTYGKSEFRIDPKTGKKKQYDLPPEQWIYLDVPDLAIISNELWEQAQIRSEKNKINTRWTSRNRGKFLLTGFIVCPHCTRKIGGFAKKSFLKRKQQLKETYSYGCRNHVCTAYGRTIEQYKLDGLVWNWLKKQINDEQILVDGINRLFKIKQDRLSDEITRKDELEQFISATTKQIARLTKSLSRIPEDDDATAEPLEKEITLLSRQKTKAEKDLKNIENLIVDRGVTEEQKQETLTLAREIGRKMDQGEQAPTPNKRRLLEMMDLKIELHLVGKRFAVVSWGFGEKPETLQFDETEPMSEDNGSSSPINGKNGTKKASVHEIPLFNSISRFIRFEGVLELD